MTYLERNSVKITDGFWKQKRELNRKTTINAVWDRFYDTGRINAFKFDWKEGMDNKPHIFWDSDVAKWMEAAAYLIEEEYDEKLSEKLEWLIDRIEENQQDDGYFNIYFTVCEPEKRFKDRNCHELYCAGHLIEAAIAYYNATGKDRFLKCMEKYADLIYKVFVIEGSANFETPGHQEIELALIRMYNVTGNEKYLKLSDFFINTRGNSSKDSQIFFALYAQYHLPAREQKTAIGHAVRACYWYTAMADMAYEKNDIELAERCRDIFGDIINKKMYVTGGIGSISGNEAFTIDYDLPNDTAYSETCAAIAMMFFCKSLSKLENKAIYADIIEKELYNAMVSALSLDGKSFFYVNPLEINLRNYEIEKSIGRSLCLPIAQRKEVFGCSCCPPNINRLFASINNYIYAVDNDILYVNQFMASVAENGDTKVKQVTNYPADGKINLQFENAKTVMVRIPSWCDEYSVDCEYTLCDGYIVLNAPKEVNIEFIMKPMLMCANANVQNNVGKAAVQYGPVIYCAEAIDNEIENLHSLYIDRNAKFDIKYNSAYGMNEIVADGFMLKHSDELYTRYDEQFEKRKIALIPYYCFANRGESNMIVWINVR